MKTQGTCFIVIGAMHKPFGSRVMGKFSPTEMLPVPGWKITPGSVNELALAAPAQARTRRPARKNRALLIYTPPAGIGLYQRLHARVQSCDQLLHLRPNNINRL